MFRNIAFTLGASFESKRSSYNAWTILNRSRGIIGYRKDVSRPSVHFTPAIKYLNQCHSGERQNPGKQPGCRIKSGTTSVSYFISRLIPMLVVRHRRYYPAAPPQSACFWIPFPSSAKPLALRSTPGMRAGSPLGGDIQGMPQHL